MRTRSDADVAAPPPALNALSQLVDHADPDPDLLNRIEARIDADMPKAPAPPRPRRWSYVGLLMVVAICSAAMGYLAGPGQQEISARPSADATWIPLGSVQLRGPALRAFVRSKCQGHTHFFITMHGLTVEPGQQIEGPGKSLSQAGEKILMECIF